MSEIAHQQGFVYFLCDRFNDDGPIKISWSGDPVRRCAAINRSLRHEWLTVVAWFPGTYNDEWALHAHWREHRVLGEWFRPAPEIVAAIDLCRLLHAEAAA